MKIVIIGAGKVGSALVESFIKEDHDITVVDCDSEKIESIVNKFDANGIVGGGLDRDILIEAGVENADFLIACTSRDETNILCGVISKKLGAKYTIARVRDPQCYKEAVNVKEVLGLDLAFNPELRAANDIAEVLKFPSAKSIESFAGGKAVLAKFELSGGNPVIGKSLMEVAKEYGAEFLFGMVKRGEEVYIPRGDFVLSQDDSVFVIATETQLEDFCKKIKIFKPKAKSVFIVGGGKIAYYLAKELIDSGIGVKIIDSDKSRCEELSVELPSATVIFGDGTDQALLTEENLQGSDAVVTLTGKDEENVIISLYAKQQNIEKVVTKINRPTIMGLVNNLGFDTLISPQVSIANHIISFVRRYCAKTEEEGIDALYKLDDKIEVAEFTVGEGFEGLNIPLKELKIRKDVLIGGIVRKNKFILPSGETAFSVGDRIIIVTAIRGVSQLADILK